MRASVKSRKSKLEEESASMTLGRANGTRSISGAKEDISGLITNLSLDANNGILLSISKHQMSLRAGFAFHGDASTA